MLRGQIDPIEKTAQEIETLLSQTGGANKTRKATKSSSAGKLPRRLRREIKNLDDARRRAQHIPYRPASEIAAARATVKRVDQHLNKQEVRAKRKSGIKAWIAHLILNYFYFLIALVGFWYIATRL